MVEKLHPFSIRVNDNHGWKRSWNRRNWNVEFDNDNFFDWDVEVDYTMGNDGRLVDPGKPVKENLTNKNNYRYKTDEELKNEIQQREQKVKEEMQKIEEDKKRLNDSLNKKSGSSESLDNEDDATTISINSPIFSLVKFIN
jgi:predicted porin